MAAVDDDNSAKPAQLRRCFVVSAFGATADEKVRTKQVLRHLVRKVLEPRGYDVLRADEIDDEGLITNQIIEHLLEDDLVVADLTGKNPNVFYEVAVRHAARKPIVHLITAGEAIPFDIANMRAIQYALDDPDVLEHAQEELERKVIAIEDKDGEAALNPITAARDVALLRGSDEPELRHAGDILAAVNDLRDDLRAASHRAAPLHQGSRGLELVASAPSAIRAERIREGVLRAVHTNSEVPYEIVDYLAQNAPVLNKALAPRLGYSSTTISRYMRMLEDGGMVKRQGSWWGLDERFAAWIDDRRDL